jgi:hypothetical protein
MKERPILFSAPMVRALLDGSKTQTRRVAKGVQATHARTGEPLQRLDSAGPRVPCQYGQPGDRLWVRENGWERPERTPKMMREGADTWARYYYDADVLAWQDVEDFKAWGFKRRPSIHMPRWASRIELEVTNVRVERLRDISEADAFAEGIERKLRADRTLAAYDDVCRFAALWEAINGTGSWAANPWVWVVEFRRIKP